MSAGLPDPCTVVERLCALCGHLDRPVAARWLGTGMVWVEWGPGCGHHSAAPQLIDPAALVAPSRCAAVLDPENPNPSDCPGVATNGAWCSLHALTRGVR